MLALIIKSMLLLTLALSVGRLLSDARLTLRLLLWRSTLVAVILLLPLQWLLPSWELPVLPAQAHVPGATLAAITAPSQMSINVGESMAWWNPVLSLGVIWVLGSVWMAAGLLRSLRSLRCWARSAGEVDADPLLSRVRRMGRVLGLQRVVRVGWSGQVQTPISWGWLRPRILLPTAWQHNDRVTEALAHEMAHLRRRDWLWLMAARFAQILFWWQPLLSAMLRRLADDTEMACDRLALILVDSPAGYARALLAASADQGRIARLAVALSMNPHPLERRIRGVLNDNQRRQPMRSTESVVIPALVAILTVPMAACQVSRAQPAPETPTPVEAPAAPVADARVPSEPGLAPRPVEPAPSPDSRPVPTAPKAASRSALPAPAAPSRVRAEAEELRRAAEMRRREAQADMRAAELAQREAARQVELAARNRERRDRQEAKELERFAEQERHELALERDHLERERAALAAMRMQLQAELDELSRLRREMEAESEIR